MMLYMGGLGAAELLMMSIVFFIPFLLMVWALIDALTSNFKDSNTKLLWVLVILFVPLLGWILYFSIGRSQKLTT